MVIGASRSPPGTVAEAVARYLGSATFTNNFQPANKAMRRSGAELFSAMSMATNALASLNWKMRRVGVASASVCSTQHAQDASGRMAFAVTEGLIDGDPTVGVKLRKVKDTERFATGVRSTLNSTVRIMHSAPDPGSRWS